MENLDMGKMVKSHYGNLFPQELSIRALLSFSRHALWLSCYAYDGFFFGLPWHTLFESIRLKFRMQ